MTRLPPKQNPEKLIAEIAAECLLFPSLTETKSGADFREVAVWTVREALLAAFAAGARELANRSDPIHRNQSLRKHLADIETGR